MSVSFRPFFRPPRARSETARPAAVLVLGAPARGDLEACSKKVAQKRSQGLGIVRARNFVRRAASGRRLSSCVSRLAERQRPIFRGHAEQSAYALEQSASRSAFDERRQIVLRPFPDV